MRKCYDCKFCDMDYIFDEEEGDEYEIWTCNKGHDTDSEEECVDYKKYNEKKPKETFSECDSCKYLSECGNVIECTESWNLSRHYVKGMGYCRKDSEVQENVQGGVLLWMNRK